MGEAFLGLPNRFRVVDSVYESTFDPNHILSAHTGYILWNNFNNYLPLTGGAMSGTLYTQNILPGSSNTYNIGSSSNLFNAIYAKTFTGSLDGNASTADKLKTSITVNITGSVTGNTSFDGSSDVTIDVETSHNHDDVYLKLSGGTMSGNLTLGIGTGIVDGLNRIILQETGDGKLEINPGGYNNSVGSTIIYSAGDVELKTASSGVSITSSQFDRSVNVGTSEDSIFISNTGTNDFLYMTDDNKLKFNDNEVYHHGNFKPENLLTTEYREHMYHVKQVMKVMTILLDKLEVYTGSKSTRDYPEEDIADTLEYYKTHAMEYLDQQ